MPREPRCQSAESPNPFDKDFTDLVEQFEAPARYKRRMEPERRRQMRHPVKISATLVAGDGLDRMAVAITDISDAGAGLAFRPSSSLHGEIYMLIPDNTLQPCRLVWHQDGRFGLSFL